MKKLLLLLSVLLLLSGCASESVPSSDLTSNEIPNAPTEAVEAEPDAESIADESETNVIPAVPIPDTADEAGLTIVCLGDSVTAGVFELQPCDEFFLGYVCDTEAAYPALLAGLLADNGIKANVVNAGVSGNTVENGIDRLVSDVYAYSPDIVTVCFGLNDVCGNDAEWFADNLSTLFTLILDYDENIKIVFITPNMLADHVNEEVMDSYINYVMALGNENITESGALDEYMDAARKVCDKFGIPVCDVYAHWKTLYDEGQDITALLASHVTHPVRAMHHVFAEMLLDTLTSNGMLDDYK